MRLFSGMVEAHQVNLIWHQARFRVKVQIAL
jgi:hypothetical protein